MLVRSYKFRDCFKMQKKGPGYRPAKIDRTTGKIKRLSHFFETVFLNHCVFTLYKSFIQGICEVNQQTRHNGAAGHIKNIFTICVFCFYTRSAVSCISFLNTTTLSNTSTNTGLVLSTSPPKIRLLKPFTISF